MIIGTLAKWIECLDSGKAVVLSRDVLVEAAGVYRDSGLDHVRPEYIQNIVDEVNSEEYEGFSLWERPDGRWTLEKYQNKSLSSSRLQN